MCLKNSVTFIECILANLDSYENPKIKKNNKIINGFIIHCY